MLHKDGYLELDRADVVKYLHYRTHQQMIYRGEHCDGFEIVVKAEDDDWDDLLDFIYIKGILMDGSSISKCSTFTQGELLAKHERGDNVEFYINLDNHDSIIYLLDDVWYVLAYGDYCYWLYALDNFDVESFNRRNALEQIDLKGKVHENNS